MVVANSSIDSFSPSKAANKFAFDCLAKMSEREGNLAFSPFSAWTVLTLITAGARGETRVEMEKVLHLPESAEVEIYNRIGAWEESLNGIENIQLGIANRIWASPDFSLTQHFDRLIKNSFKSGFERQNFATSTEDARKRINEWIAQKTNGRINELLTSYDVVADTKLILTNAVFFKASWQNEFLESDTTERPFFKTDATSFGTQMMSQKGDMCYFENDHFQAVQFFYDGEQTSMIVFLPRNRDDRALTQDDFDAVYTGLRYQPVFLCLPRFVVNESICMVDLLKSLGMRQAFTEVADFGRMSEDVPLTIGNVLHQSFVEVAEKGTEAAAATAVIAVAGRAGLLQEQTPKEMIVDHPFYFCIIDNIKRGILFFGRVNDPRK